MKTEKASAGVQPWHSVATIESQLQGILAEEHQLLAGDVFLRGSLEHLEHQNTMIIQLLRELLRRRDVTG